MPENIFLVTCNWSINHLDSIFAAFTNKGKFLLAVRRYRHGAHMEYIISLNPDDSSQGSNAYVGKLR